MRRTSSLVRLGVLLAVFAFALGGIVVRLAILQVGEHGEFETLGVDQRLRTMDLPAGRGQILDRAGTPLALSLDARDVYADANLVIDPAGTAERLAPPLGMRVGEVERILTRPGTSFRFVAQQVDDARAAKIERMGLPGIGFLPVSKRYYPAGELAPQVLGFVGRDGVGLAGLELQYEDVLAGTAGERLREVDPGGRTIVHGISSETPPIPGGDVVTTIDRPLTFQVQAALETAVQKNGAKGGTVVVMDPHTGEVLVMATAPGFDPNAFAEYEDVRLQELARNRAVVDAFEPGSVNKVITVAAAVEERAIPLDERVPVASSIKIGESTIHDAHSHPLEQMTIGDILAYSSNVGTIHVADRLGSGPLATYLARFGFGRTTGIGFPGESSGYLPPLLQWSDTSRATMAFGQGVSATPLQMAAAYATIANKGVYRQPQLVSGTVDVGGSFEPAAEPITRRVVSEQTARTVTQMLAYAVEDGTGEAASVAGYQVAGKTGTARIASPRGGYLRGKYVASFMGFLPASDPEVVIVASLDQPATDFGGIAAAPLFSEVARFAIRRMGIPQGHRLPLPPHALPVR